MQFLSVSSRRRMEVKKAMAREAGCINCRCDGRCNATSPKESRWHVCLRCARWRSATVRWKKRRKWRTQGAAALSAARDWEPSTTMGARFIVPLGILHLSSLAANLAVYATPTSNWHASACACMLLSIIPDSTRHCYRVIFWKFVRGSVAWNEICPQDLRWCSRGTRLKIAVTDGFVFLFRFSFGWSHRFFKEEGTTKLKKNLKIISKKYSFVFISDERKLNIRRK